MHPVASQSFRFSERSSFCSNRTQACRFRQTDNSSQAVKGNVLRDWLKYFQICFKFHRKIWIKKLRVEQDTADRIENFAGFWFFLKGQSGKRLVIWEYIYSIDRNFKNGGQIKKTDKFVLYFFVVFSYVFWEIMASDRWQPNLLYILEEVDEVLQPPLSLVLLLLAAQGGQRINKLKLFWA